MPVRKIVWILLAATSKHVQVMKAGLHKPKKDTTSTKEGKVSSLCRGGQRLKAGLLIRRKSWPRATENIVQVAQSGRHAGVGFLILQSKS